jgi:F0F1-type ATP synthase assembly protein I
MPEEQKSTKLPISPPRNRASSAPPPGDVGTKKSTSREYSLFVFKIIGDFGAAIAVPIVLLALAGQYLDEKYHRGPIFTILGFILAAFISGKIIYKKAKIYGEEYKRLGEKEG